jgi:hypothetical protein
LRLALSTLLHQNPVTLYFFGYCNKMLAMAGASLTSLQK